MEKIDSEYNVLGLQNKDDILLADEENKLQIGKEFSHAKEDNIRIIEENENSSEENSIIETKRKKNQSNVNTNVSSNALKATFSLPTIAVTLVTTVVVVGGATGIIPTPYSTSVHNFLSSSTELGFEMSKDPEKTYLMTLTGEEYESSEEITLRNQCVFYDLMPNTTYDLNVYDITVQPIKKIYSANYLTKAFEDYFIFLEEEGVEEDILSFYLGFEGREIDFLTVEVIGNNSKTLYLYEGEPQYEYSVNIMDNTDVSCKISINGKLVHFQHLLNPDVKYDWFYNEDVHWHDIDGEIVDKAPHSLVEHVIVEPTFEETGLGIHVCDICGYESDEYEIPVKEHTFDLTYWEYDEHTHWRRCLDPYPYNALKGFEQEHIFGVPYKTENGWDFYKCEHCDYEKIGEHVYTLEEVLTYELNDTEDAYAINGFITNSFNWTRDFVLPTEHEGLPITAITYEKPQTEGGMPTFYNRTMTSVVIPDTYTSITSGSFFGCNYLESITIPFVGGSKTTTNLSPESFFAYIFLANGPYIFDKGYYIDTRNYDSNPDLYEMEVPKSLKTINITGGIIHDHTLRGLYYVEEINISGVTHIGDYAFADYMYLNPTSGEVISNINSIAIDASVQSFGAYLFSDNPLEEITFNGTIDQWNAITKDGNWNTNSRLNTIHCDDGDITI